MQRIGDGQKCGCKHEFHLTCKAVSNGNGKILNISIAYGVSAGDCVAFEASDLLFYK